MLSVRTTFRALLLGASFLFVSCADLPTEPGPEALQVAPSQGLLDGLGDALDGTVETLVRVVNEVVSPVMTRAVPLDRDEVITQTIGPMGGVIELPRAGLTMVVPRGALDKPTRITVTAPAGDLLGYEFAPHGLQFKRPVTLRQEITREQARAGMEVVYFDGDLLPQVTVLEVLPVSTSRTEATFRIEHFSGYAARERGYVIATN